GFEEGDRAGRDANADSVAGIVAGYLFPAYGIFHGQRRPPEGATTRLMDYDDVADDLALGAVWKCDAELANDRLRRGVALREFPARFGIEAGELRNDQ